MHGLHKHKILTFYFGDLAEAADRLVGCYGGRLLQNWTVHSPPTSLSHQQHLISTVLTDLIPTKGFFFFFKLEVTHA